jgi:hypothetical protein
MCAWHVLLARCATFVKVGLAAALTVSLAGSAAAQTQPDIRTQMALWTQQSLTGTVVAVAQGELLAKGADGTNYHIVLVDTVSEVQVSGTAKVDYLKSGMFLRFSVPDMDKRGNAKGDLSDLALFEPSEATPPQLLAEGEDGPYFVAGRITKVDKRGKTTLMAGDSKVTVMLPLDSEITVLVGDYSLAKEGDEISVVGRLVPNPMAGDGGEGGEGEETLVAAETVAIKLAAPLEAAKKRPRRTPARTEEPAEDKPATETPAE